MNSSSENRQSPGPASWIRRCWESDWGRFIALFFGLTVIGCFPLIVHPFQHLAMKPFGDKGTNLWNLWWVYYALFERGCSPLRCDSIFIPWGCDLRYHTLSLANGVIAAPVTALFGPVAAYNVLFAVWTCLTGVFASLWARRFNLGIAAAALVGFIAAFGPYRWSHQVHLNLFSTPWLFLAFYQLERTFDTGWFRNVVFFTLAWILAALTDWYYALFIGVYLGIRAGCFLLEKRTLRHTLVALQTMVLPFIVVFGIIVAYFHQPAGAMFEESFVDSVPMKFSAYWSLDVYHLFLPAWGLPGGAPIQADGEFCLHPGLLFLLLPGIWLFVKNRGDDRWRRRFLKLALFGFILLSFGPFLQIGGYVARLFSIPIILPTALLELIPSLTVIRVFARFAYVGFLIWCLLGVMGLERWMKHRKPSWSMAVLTLICGCLFLFETGWRFPKMAEHRLSHEYSIVDPTPVLEIPFTPSFLSGLHLYHQTIHRRPIFVAEFSRLGNYKKRYLSAYPALALLDRLSREDEVSVEDRALLESDFCLEFSRLGRVDMRVSFPFVPSDRSDRIWNRLRDTIQACGENGRVFKLFYEEPVLD